VCALPGKLFLCITLILYFHGTLLGYFLSDYHMVPIVPVTFVVYIPNSYYYYYLLLSCYFYCCCLLSQVFSSWYFFWNSGDPHRSGFKFHTAVLSVLCVMFPSIDVLCSEPVESFLIMASKVLIHHRHGAPWVQVVARLFMMFIWPPFTVHFILQTSILQRVCTNRSVFSCHYCTFCFSLNVSRF
jgi:hypothetical protein